MTTERQKLIEIVGIIISDIEEWSLEDKALFFATIFSVDPKLSKAIAMVESSMGKNQLSPTGASGVYQMTGIAMEDLLLDMRKYDDELGDVAVGHYFLRVLSRRWKRDPKQIVYHFCDPKEREAYWAKVEKIMNPLHGTNGRVPA